MTDQCGVCGQANRAEARFCSGCGARLAVRCEACGVELAPGARFCDACGAAAPGSATQVEASRRTVSVIFSDLAGSTALQEALDPESVRRLMARYYEVMRTTVHRYGGQIEKFIGDAVIAVFGKPAVREDDAIRAVRCAAAMVADLDALNEELERAWGVRLAVRTGVNTGELVINPEGILVGDTMNTAARLEQAAPAGEVLIGEATWRLVRHHMSVEEVAPLELRGKAAPVRAWRLVSAAPPGPGEEPRAGGAADSPLIGRRAELGLLEAALADTIAARHCRLVTVIASPGLGKSRLASEFARAVGERARVVQGHCEASGEGITFLPVAEIVREVAAIGESDSPELVREKLLLLAEEDDPDRRRLVERVAGLLGVGDVASAQETFWALRRGLEAIARRHPLVLVLDDLHWGQPMLLDLVEHLVEWVVDAPVLLLALARPELRETREVLCTAGRRASVVVELGPLAVGESRALVGGLLGDSVLPDELVTRILETTEGNPLFLSELVRMLIDDGTLVRGEDGWTIAGGADAVDVPPTIQALLSARIERLEAGERAVVERAAVIGKQFYRGAVAELLAPPARSAIDGNLEALRRKEMVEPEGIYWIDEPVYRFHHILIRDAAYRLLLKEARAALHERFADWLAEKAGDLVGEFEEVIAFHLEQAHGYLRELAPARLLDERGRALGARAAQRLGSAGRRALAREDLAAAANLLRRALACEAGSEEALLWDLAEVVLSAGDAAAAGEVVERYAAASAGDPRGEARQVVLRAQLANLVSDADPAATVAGVQAAAVQLDELEDPGGAAKAWSVAALCNARLGQVGAVEATLDRALTAARAAEDRRRTTAVLAAAPRAALWGPSPVTRASGRCLDVVRILRMTAGNRHLEAMALRCQAVLEAMRGRFDAAREILAGGRATLEELGLSLELSETRVYAGVVELVAGDPDAAVRELRAALDGFLALGADAAAAHAAAMLARALVALGGADQEALTQCAFAEEHGGEDLRTAIILAAARGEALAATGQREAALDSARRAVELAAPTDALADKADAAMSLARVLAAAGLAHEARDAAGEALALYIAKAHTVGAERAAALAGDAPGPVGVAMRATPTATDVLGEHASERLLAEIHRLQRARDYEQLATLVTEDWYRVDYRGLALWDDLRGRDAFLETMRSVFDFAPDLREEVDEVLACDEHVLAGVMAWRGRGLKQGELEVRAGAVYLFRDGRWAGAEYYEPDDRQALMGRYVELGGGRGSVPGDQPPERVHREYCARFNRGDIGGLLELSAEDIVLVDRRTTVSQEVVRGHGGVEPFLQGLFASMPDARYEIEEVLACDERVIALRALFHGHSPEGGGRFEVPAGIVAVIVDGCERRVELFDGGAEDAMRVRFRELGGGVLGDRAPERLETELVLRVARRDLDALAELYSPDYALSDHRLVASQSVLDHAAIRGVYESVFAISPDIEFRVDEVLACDERVIAMRCAFSGHAADGGGIAEQPIGVVSVIEDGRFVSDEQFEPEDRQAMIARYLALGGGLSALGATPPERVVARFLEHYAARELEPMLDLTAGDIQWVDHRSLGWEPIRDREGVAALLRSSWEGTRDMRIEVEEVLACDERAVALCFRWIGHNARGGAFELPAGQVIVCEDGLYRSVDQYGPDDRDALLARFEEVRGSRAVVLGDRPVERCAAEFIRRVAARDLEAILALLAPGYRVRDHRTAVRQDASDPATVRAMFESALEISPDLRFDVDELLACDDRVLAARVGFRGLAADGGGDFDVSFGSVWLVEDGRIVSTDRYEYDATDAMLQRYAQLGGRPAGLGDRRPERLFVEYLRRFATHDLDALMELYPDEFVQRDHRQIGTLDVGDREELRLTFQSVFATSSDARVDLDEVLACDERVIAVRMAFRGTDDQFGGAYEVAVGVVSVMEGDRVVSSDHYEPEDDAAILARFEELRAETESSSARNPERWVARFVATHNGHDPDAFAALLSEDFVLVDHRANGWGRIEGPDALRENHAAAFLMAPDIRMEIDAVLAGDDRVGAVSFTYRGHMADGGGEFEYSIGFVTLVEGGRALSTDVYEPEDREAMLARFAELSGSAVLGDRPPERFYAEYARRWAAADQAAMLELIDEDWVLTDHRSLSIYGRLRGRQDARDTIASSFQGVRQPRFTVSEVLACDDRVIAARIAWSGFGSHGAEFSNEMGLVSLVRDGREVSADLYEPDDRQAMIVRYVELGGGLSALGDSPVERASAEHSRRLARRDLDAIVAQFHDDYVMRDHRATVSRDVPMADVRAAFEALLSVTETIRLETDEVLACDERVIARRLAHRGTAADGGGALEVRAAWVSVVQDGLLFSTDVYEYDDDASLLARFAELSDSAAGCRAPE